MVLDLAAFFEEYEWNMEEVEPSIWMGSFSSSAEEDFDLFVRLSEEWVNLAVSPVTPRPPEGLSLRLAHTLLRLNECTQMVRFTLDNEGDITLLADLPVEDLHFTTLATAIDMLTATTALLAAPLARVVQDPDLWPSEFVDLGIQPSPA